MPSFIIAAFLAFPFALPLAASSRPLPRRASLASAAWEEHLDPAVPGPYPEVSGTAGLPFEHGAAHPQASRLVVPAGDQGVSMLTLRVWQADPVRAAPVGQAGLLLPFRQS